MCPYPGFGRASLRENETKSSTAYEGTSYRGIEPTCVDGPLGFELTCQVRTVVGLRKRWLVHDQRCRWRKVVLEVHRGIVDAQRAEPEGCAKLKRARGQ